MMCCFRAVFQITWDNPARYITVPVKSPCHPGADTSWVMKATALPSQEQMVPSGTHKGLSFLKQCGFREYKYCWWRVTQGLKEEWNQEKRKKLLSNRHCSKDIAVVFLTSLSGPPPRSPASTDSLWQPFSLLLIHFEFTISASSFWFYPRTPGWLRLAGPSEPSDPPLLQQEHPEHSPSPKEETSGPLGNLCQCCLVLRRTSCAPVCVHGLLSWHWAPLNRAWLCLLNISHLRSLRAPSSPCWTGPALNSSSHRRGAPGPAASSRPCWTLSSMSISHILRSPKSDTASIFFQFYLLPFALYYCKQLSHHKKTLPKI